MPDAPSVTFTMFTATYNRARTLHRVWESLRAQTYRDFEWLIVDDGSTDHTAELVAGFAREANFPVRYFYQTNQHKKVAINHALREARGKFISFLDSDDEIVPHALERLWFHWQSIPAEQRARFSGVTGLCMDEQGGIIGDRFPGEPGMDSTSVEMAHRWRVRGEKWGFQRVDVLRDYLFPEDVPGLVPESYMWDQVAERYQTRYFNEALRLYHRDQDDALTARQTHNPVGNARGLLLGVALGLRSGARWWRQDFWELLRQAVNVTRLSLHHPQPLQVLVREWRRQLCAGRVLMLLGLPLALLLWLRDKSRHRASDAVRREASSLIKV